MDKNTDRQKIGINESVIDMLARKYKHGAIDERLRVLALVEVTQEHPTLTALLNSALKDKSPRVRAKTLEVTARYSPSSLEDIAIFLMRDSNSDVRRSAIKTLGTLYSSRSLDTMLNALCDDPSHWVRWEAMRHITFYDTNSVKEAIRTRLYDPHPLVRRRACEYFAVEMQPVPVSDIAPMVNDDDQWVRFFAIEGLRASNDKRALRGLVTALRHNDPLTRERAARAIGYLGFEEALPHLEYAYTEFSEMNRVLSSAIKRIREIQGIVKPKPAPEADPTETTIISRLPPPDRSPEAAEKHRNVVNRLISFIKRL